MQEEWMSEHEHDPHAASGTGHDAQDTHDAHAAQALGPVDWPAWGMAILGGALAVLVAWTLVLAAHP
jgi:hypothetical protein